MQQGETIRSNQLSVSAALAAANAASTLTRTDSPAEYSQPSLAEMAQRDLDAALQLLAERAQYITGANGAAIALRRDGKKDMLCRASAGCNVPEIGALLSAEFGLSGESVKTKQPLRCDNTERDERVNREVCRQMGIASVAVMPVVDDDEVMGVFELFSGRVSAFGERDLSALQRLSGMVETAVRLAHASATFPEQVMKDPKPAAVREVAATPEPPATTTESIEVELESSESAPPASAQGIEPSPTVASIPESAETALPPLAAESVDPPVVEAKKPLLWSASLGAAPSPHPSAELDQSHVPPVLRNLHKCKACGFPVSEGRLLCVECEEKRWRGQLRGTQSKAVIGQSSAPLSAPNETRAFAAAQSSAGIPKGVPTVQPLTTQMILATAKKSELEKEHVPEVKVNASTPNEPSIPAAAAKFVSVPEGPILSAGLESSQSWVATNKYIFAVLLLIAGVIMAVLLLR